MRKLLIAGNWKMNKVRDEARQFVTEFLPLVAEVQKVEVLLCPPFTCLEVMQLYQGIHVVVLFLNRGQAKLPHHLANLDMKLKQF